MATRPWKWIFAVVLGLVANVAVPASLPVNDADNPPGAIDASAMMKFYPMPLATSPAGVIEDRQVWLAKVQGLVADAPGWLQQNVLSSRSKAEFSANLSLMQHMHRGSLDEAGLALKSLAKCGKVGTKALGDTANLVYREVPPCRIMDSRNALGGSGVQGPLSGNVLYHVPGYITAGSNWGLYGGNGSSDCGLNSSYGSSISAVAIVITILNPNFDAFLGVTDVNSLSTVLSNVALNYTHGQGLSTMYIVPQDVANTIYFAMPAQLVANLIFDVVGFFHVSDATALDCHDIRHSVGMPAATYTTDTVTCDAGYTRTGGGCYVQTIDTMDLLVHANPDGAGDGDWFCAGTSSGANTLHTQVRCCRLPGR